MSDFNVPKNILDTKLAFVPALYSLNQLKKMRERILDGEASQTLLNPVKRESDVPVADSNNEDISDDEISVISVKMASKPTPKQVTNSFEATLKNHFNLEAKTEEIKEMPGKGLDQVKKDKEINNVEIFGDTFTNLKPQNKKKVLDKQIMIENLRKQVLNEAEQLEEKMISINRQEKQINELNKIVECLTKEKDVLLKNETNNKREMNKIKASFVERNLEIEELKNKVILLTNNCQYSEDIRKQNKTVIDNLKSSKNVLTEQEKEHVAVINNLKTDLKILPIQEKKIEQLQKEVNLLSEKYKDFQLLKTIVLPEKDKQLENLGNKVMVMVKDDIENKSIMEELRIKLDTSEKKATESSALFWHTLSEKEENIKSLQERVTELTKNGTALDTQLTQKVKELSEKDKFLTDLLQNVSAFEAKENEFTLKLDEKNKEILKKEEIIEYFEAKVSELSKKQKHEHEQNQNEINKLKEGAKQFEQVKTSLQSEKEKSQNLEVNLIELSDKNAELSVENSKLQEVNENYELKINHLRSELVEVNISNMFENASHDSESDTQLKILSKEKEELMEQNNNLLMQISIKETESLSLESIVNENKSNLLMQQEINKKHQETINELQERNTEKDKSLLTMNMKMEELTGSLSSTESSEKEARKNIAVSMDKIKLLENKLDEKRRLLTTTSESNKVLNKKYALLKTENEDLLKEVRDISALQIKIKSLEEQLKLAREDNGEEPGLVIDDKIDEPSTSRSTDDHIDEPSTSKSAKPTLSSARDPRRKAQEVGQNTTSTDSNELLPNSTYAPIQTAIGSSTFGEYQEQMKIPQTPLPFTSIFDIPSTPEERPPLKSTTTPKLSDVISIPAPSSTDSAKSPTSHLNAGLSQLSNWMKSNTIKNLTDYKPVTVPASPKEHSSSPQKNTADYSSSRSYSSSGYQRKRSRSRSNERSYEESRRHRSHRRSRSRSIDRYYEESKRRHLRSRSRSRSFERDYEESRRRRSHRRSREREYYYSRRERRISGESSPGGKYYSRRERRTSGQNSPSGYGMKMEEPEVKGSNWNVIPTKYLNFLTERENVGVDLK